MLTALTLTLLALTLWPRPAPAPHARPGRLAGGPDWPTSQARRARPD